MAGEQESELAMLTTVQSNSNPKLSPADVKKLKHLAEQAACLPGMLSAVPHVSDDLVEGMLIAVQNFSQDIETAVNEIMRSILK